MQKTLSNNLSVYLDFLRISAALIVFISHIRNFLFPYLKFGPLEAGREAVAVFFVLSGFVISYVVAEKENGWRTYVASRLARIYPVAILAILTTIITGLIGMKINPLHYNELNDQMHGSFNQLNITSAISYLTFTNQLWFNHVIFGADEPYWSLGFEVQYYIFFGLISYLPRWQKIIAVMIWALICGPKILLYLPLWLLGVIGYKLVSSNYLGSKAIAAILFALSIVLLGAFKHFLGPHAELMYKSYGLKQELINFCYFTGIGLFVLINIVSFNTLADRSWKFSQGIAKAIRWAAGGSFTLYLIHQPIAVMASGILDPVEDHKILCEIAVVVILILVAILAEIAERRKRLYQSCSRFLLKT